MIVIASEARQSSSYFEAAILKNFLDFHASLTMTGIRSCT
jgi:hypothetical protein